MSDNSCELNVLNAALRYAAKEWRVFPLHSVRGGRCSCNDANCRSAGKHPRVGDWRNAASSEPAAIQSWFEQWPDANLGVVTGESVVVLDVDGYNGGEDSIEALFAQYGRPNTLQATSGSGQGTHFYFDCSGQKLPNCSDLWPGVDVRGVGGYVVADPSVHISGRRYTWDGMDGCDTVLEPVPVWLGDAILQRACGVGPTQSTSIDSYPLSEPPRDKFERLLTRSVRFKQSWERTRTDLNDPSASGYDLSLASCAVLDNWSDDEIVSLLIASRRKHKDASKPVRYFERTLSKAKRQDGAFKQNQNQTSILQIRSISVVAFQLSTVLIYSHGSSRRRNGMRSRSFTQGPFCFPVIRRPVRPSLLCSWLLQSLDTKKMCSAAFQLVNTGEFSTWV